MMAKLSVLPEPIPIADSKTLRNSSSAVSDRPTDTNSTQSTQVQATPHNPSQEGYEYESYGLNKPNGVASAQTHVDSLGLNNGGYYCQHNQIQSDHDDSELDDLLGIPSGVGPTEDTYSVPLPLIQPEIGLTLSQSSPQETGTIVTSILDSQVISPSSATAGTTHTELTDHSIHANELENENFDAEFDDLLNL